MLTFSSIENDDDFVIVLVLEIVLKKFKFNYKQYFNYKGLK